MSQDGIGQLQDRIGGDWDCRIMDWGLDYTRIAQIYPGWMDVWDGMKRWVRDCFAWDGSWCQPSRSPNDYFIIYVL